MPRVRSFNDDEAQLFIASSLSAQSTLPLLLRLFVYFFFNHLITCLIILSHRCSFERLLLEMLLATAVCHLMHTSKKKLRKIGYLEFEHSSFEVYSCSNINYIVYPKEVESKMSILGKRLFTQINYSHQFKGIEDRNHSIFLIVFVL